VTAEEGGAKRGEAAALTSSERAAAKGGGRAAEERGEAEAEAASRAEAATKVRAAPSPSNPANGKGETGKGAARTDPSPPTTAASCFSAARGEGAAP